MVGAAGAAGAKGTLPHRLTQSPRGAEAEVEAAAAACMTTATPISEQLHGLFNQSSRGQETDLKSRSQHSRITTLVRSEFDKPHLFVTFGPLELPTAEVGL